MTGKWKYVAVAVLVAAFVVPADSQTLLGRWEFEEGAGTVVNDLSGKGNNGTVFNGDIGGLGDGAETFWLNDPERGNVGSFFGDAASAYVLIDQPIPVMSLENDFTWAFWAHDLSIDAPNNIIFGNRKDVEGNDFVPRQFIKFTPTKFEWHMDGNGNDNLEYDPSEDTASNDIPDGVWIHHAVVKDGPTLTYYRNGVAMNSKEFTQPLDQPQPLFLGGDNEGSDGENWAGMLDDVRIYDGALSASQVAAVFAGQDVVGGPSNVDNFDIYQ